jgi:ABC-type multidrug transport system permease subunit
VVGELARDAPEREALQPRATAGADHDQVGVLLAGHLDDRVGRIAAVQFVLLPLTFLSSIFIARALAPEWIQSVARFNPVDWAAESGREVLGAEVDWGLVASRLGFLALFTLACAFLATRAFRAYQASV